MNKWCGVGRIVKDTEIKETSNNSKLCQFTIAVDRRFKDKDGNKQADFINCLAWGKNAEFISKYFNKGSRIGIVGSIQTRSYTAKDGKTVYVTEVVVDEAEFVESASNGDAKAEAKTEAKPSNDEMPFEI
jgi:single-strand DNA-binding protein